jgi:hypothetical protein
VEFPTRADLERRINALVADFLDDLEADFPDGVDLGPIMLITETHSPWKGDVPLRRSEAGYTPPDAGIAWRIWCSDWRRWVQLAVLEEALKLYHEPPESSDEDDLDDE